LSNAPKTYFYDGSLLTLHRLFGAHVRNRFAFVGRLESDVLDALPTTVSAGSADLPYGVGRLLMGLVFSIGLILVAIGGAELFTGNNIIVMAWASGKVSIGCLHLLAILPGTLTVIFFYWLEPSERS
jgi:hypothetical protein